MRSTPVSPNSIWRWGLMGILLVSAAQGHSGRRFEITVENHQLVARGFNSGADDGAPSPRPYTGSIHDHWQPFGPGTFGAVLPGFSIFSAATGGAAAQLEGAQLNLQLSGISVWSEAPELMPAGGWAPQLDPLGPEFTITIHDDYGGIVSSGGPGGSLILADEITLLGNGDLDLLYLMQSGDPAGSIFVFEWILSASDTAVPIIASDPIRTILSPPGADAVERRHHASLFLEESLGIPVPEPTVAGCLIASALLIMSSRRVARRDS